MIIHYSKEKFVNDLRNKTTLLGFPNFYPYKDSYIYLQTYNIRDLLPTSHYVLKSQLSKLIQLKKDLHNEGLDIFHLDGYATFFKDNENIAVTPPIVEIFQDKPLLIDGIHRVLLSDIYNTDIQCVVVKNAKPVTYAIANKNGWLDVQIFENKVPDGFKTRNHRYGDNYKDLSRVYNLEGKIFFKREHQKVYNMLGKDNER